MAKNKPDLLSMMFGVPSVPRKPTDPYTSSDYLNPMTGDYRFANSGGSRVGSNGRPTSGFGLMDGRLMNTAQIERLQADLKNPLYIRQAEKLGITKLDSANDMAQVIDALSGPKPAAPAPKEAAPAPPAPPAENDITRQLRETVMEQVKQNEKDQQLYMGMMNDLTARLTAAEQSKLNPETGYGVQVGAPGTNETGTTPSVTTTTTKAIAKRKKPGLEITAGEATGLNLAI